MAARSKKINTEQAVEAVEAETPIDAAAGDESSVLEDDFDLADIESEELALLAETSQTEEEFTFAEDSDDPMDELMALETETETESDELVTTDDDGLADFNDEIAANPAIEEAEMSETEPEEAPEPTVVLAHTLNIQHVSELHQMLKKVLDANVFIEINAAEVHAIDTCTLQLLVALKQCADNQGKPFLLTDPSERFVESVSLLGLADVFELPG